ncbi:MAG: oxalyl-CoA decarboxylase, partial [Deltaproteobacteria bacterium]
LPIVTIVFNNGGIYRGDDVNRSGGADPAPTALMKQARYEMLIEAFGGVGYSAADPQELAKSLTDALASGKPS